MKYEHKKKPGNGRRIRKVGPKPARAYTPQLAGRMMVKDFGEMVGSRRRFSTILARFLTKSTPTLHNHDELLLDAAKSRYLAERALQRQNSYQIMAVMANSPMLRDHHDKLPHFESDAETRPDMRTIHAPKDRHTIVSETRYPEIYERVIHHHVQSVQPGTIRGEQRFDTFNHTTHNVSFDSPVKDDLGRPVAGRLSFDILDGAENPTYARFYYVGEKDWPKVKRRLRTVYKRALSAKTENGALKNIAEYEWLLIHANPARRGAISMATMMSGAMRRAKGLPWDSYKRIDYDALTMSLQEYVRFRMKTFEEPHKIIHFDSITPVHGVNGMHILDGTHMPPNLG